MALCQNVVIMSLSHLWGRDILILLFRYVKVWVLQQTWFCTASREQLGTHHKTNEIELYARYSVLIDTASNGGYLYLDII